MTESKHGIVYLVGAGPGDPGLLTRRGAECLARADVVVYDRLVHPSLLSLAPPGAERIYVGKASAHHAMKQPDINRVLVDRGLKGLTVVRLKGGDPYVFGRGGEEAEECRTAGVRFEVVPGVTSAIAAPAYAGIPVTHRDAASSFAVITGHERDDAGESGARPAGQAEGRRNWAHIAHAADTLLFLMGVENLQEIAGHLQEHGRAPETPVALVRWGTWPSQQALVSTLAAVVEDVRRAQFRAPAVLVVGEVVRLRDTLRWFDTRPLFGRRVVVTRAREQASELSEQLRELGADPVEFPTIRIAPLEDYPELDDALAALASRDAARTYHWVIFTSANAVRAVRERLDAAGLDARAFGAARIAAIGPATADALREIGLRADFVPTRFVAESVAEEWPDPEMTGKRVLLPRAREAREFLPDHLRGMGAIVDVVPAYATVRDAEGAEALAAAAEQGDIDAVTFTSSSTARNFAEAIGAEGLACLGNVAYLSIGPITSATMRELGLPVTREAAEHTIPGLVDALKAHFGASS